MCLEVFVGALQPLPDEGERLVVDGSMVPKDIARRMEGLSVVHVGAAHTGCGCGLLDDADLSPQALTSYLIKAAARQPIRLVVRWGGDSLRETPTTTLPANQLASLDLGSAWDRPQDIRVES